ncbi:MAG: substrate-binding domain-containing protein [bacterium]|jgi:tungstate transport system substrate-binding protein|nr:substrate-binding domain-containing protein [bacterium]
MRKLVAPVFLLAVFLSLSPVLAERVVLATTTSTYNSGLLDVLKPRFEKDYEHTLDILSVGTGKALKYGRDGNADVLLVHAPAAEMEFMDGGYGVARVTFMFNDFVIVGPTGADLPPFDTVEELFAHISEKKSLFVSRGDDSGTHKKEKQIWIKTGLQPHGDWYWGSGQGMGNTLLIASEKQGFTLTDRGTLLAYLKKLNLKIIHEGDPLLRNPYSVMVVNPALSDKINYRGALDFMHFLLSSEILNIIRHFKKGGEVLFKPLINPAID